MYIFAFLCIIFQENMLIGGAALAFFGISCIICI